MLIDEKMRRGRSKKRWRDVMANYIRKMEVSKEDAGVM